MGPNFFDLKLTRLLRFAKLLTKLSFQNPVLKFVPEGEGEKKTTFVRPTQLGFRFDFDSQKGPKGGKRLFEPKSPETEWNQIPFSETPIFASEPRQQLGASGLTPK